MRAVIILIVCIVISLAVSVELFAQDSENIQKIGSIDYNLWNSASDVEVIDSLVYLATKESGFQIIDITEADDPTVIGNWRPDYYYDYQTLELAVTAEYAFVPDGSTGFYVISIEEQVNPIEVGYYERDLARGFITDIAVSGELVYMSYWYGFEIISIENPENPEFVSSCDVAEYPNEISGVAVSGDYVYLAVKSHTVNGNGGLIIVSIEDIDDLSEEGEYEIRESVLDIEVSGDLAYLVCYSQRFGNGMRIIDVSSPIEPFEAGYFEIDERAYDVSIVGDYAFIASSEVWRGGGHDDGGFRIVSISNPDSLFEIGHDYNSSSAVGVAVSNDCAYLADESLGLSIVSVEEPEDPEFIGSFNNPGEVSNVTIVGDFAFVSAGEYGMSVLEIANPRHPQEVGRLNTPGNTNDVAISGDNAFIADGSGGVRVVSIADPEEPDEVDTLELREKALSVKIQDDYAYVTVGEDTHWEEPNFGWGNSKRGKLYSIEIDDPEEIRVAGTSDYIPGYAEDVAISNEHVYVVSGGISYNHLNDELPTITDLGEFVVFSDDDPENLDSVSACTTIAHAKRIDISGDYAYVVDQDWYIDIWLPHTYPVGGWLRIISIEEPESPVEVACIEADSLEAPWDVDVFGQYAFLASGPHGLRVWSVEDSADLHEVGYFDTPGTARGVTVAEDGLIYVADGYSLDIYRHQPEGSAINVIPGKIDFDSVLVGEYAEQSVTIHSWGLDTLTVSDMSIEGEVFTIDFEDEIDLAPDSSQEFTVTFSPDSAREYSRVLTISTNDAILEEYHVEFFGIGYTPDLVEEDDLIPDQFYLDPAFPNPFNASTTISYGLPKADDISLQVYDLTGRRVRTLVEGRMEAGMHAVTMNAGDMPSGLYFVRLEAGKEVMTRKVILQK